MPIARRQEWDEVKAFCKRVADLVVAAVPKQFTANMAKHARTGRIFIDYLRNGRGATAVAPYSPRSRPGAPVSVPITWDELSGRQPTRYTFRTLRKRLSALKADPWAGIGAGRQGLAGPIKKLRTFDGV